MAAAVDAKIQVGDVITAINATPASSFEPGALRALFKGSVGTKITLHVRSTTGERDVTLVLRDVV